MTSTLLQQAVEALKPCPFCGSDAEVHEFAGGYVAQCGTCDARTPSRLTPAYATTSWNHRTTESALQQQPDDDAGDLSWDHRERTIAAGKAALRQQPEPVATFRYEVQPDGESTYDVWLSDGMFDIKRPGDYPLYTAHPALQQQEEPREVAPRDLYAKWITTYGMNVEECSMPNYDYLSPAEHAAWEAVAALASPSPQDFTLPMVEEGKARTDLEWFRLPEIFAKFVDYAEKPVDENALRIIRAVAERTAGAPAVAASWDQAWGHACPKSTGVVLLPLAQTCTNCGATADGVAEKGREEALRRAGAAGLDPDSDVVGDGVNAPGEGQR